MVRLAITLVLVLVGTSLSTVAFAATSPSSSPSPSAGSATPSPAGTGVADSASSASPSPTGTTAAVPAPAARAAAPVTRIYAHAKSVGISGKPRFSYGSDRTDVQFRCRLRGPGRQDYTFRICPKDSADSLGGRVRYSGLTANRNRYAFMVQAFVPRTRNRAEIPGPFREYAFHIFTVTAPDHFSPRPGATFNRPLSKSDTKVNINKMIRTINSMPGYRQATRTTCPWNPDLRPSTIRISLYSLTGHRFAAALAAAHRRCVSVQVLMNNHLDRSNDPSWRLLEDALGTRAYGEAHARRSFAHRCSYGCRGSGVLHTKMFLFDASAPSKRFNDISSMVTMGSSNMTFNATDIQWNDLYTVRGRADLYQTYLHQFNLMKRDNGVFRRLLQFRDGSYQTTFWPQDRGGADPYMQTLRSIRCTGATGGAGYRGRTVVHINMHAWFNDRGMGLARQVRSLYNQGCYVRILYSFMSYGVYKTLHNGTGGRMSVRRTLFSHDGYHGYVYSHFKNILASGVVGNDSSARVVWTGSNNFTDGGTHYDEVMMKIPFTSVYNDYQRHFVSMSRTKSTPVWAIFQEPEGGGRAPRTMAPRAFDVPEDEAYDIPPGTPVIEAPPGVIEFDENGEPRALD